METEEMLIKHVMDLIKVYPSGAEKWGCTDCDKQIILRWRPLPFSRIILSDNNPEILHSFNKGGLQISGEALESMDDNWRSQLEDVLNNLQE